MSENSNGGPVAHMVVVDLLLVLMVLVVLVYLLLVLVVLMHLVVVQTKKQTDIVGHILLVRVLGSAAEWTQESPHPDAIHFQGSGFGYPPYNYGGGGSGYHGGGGTADPGGYTGGAGGGSGYSNPTYVPTPSLEYEAAVGSHHSLLQIVCLMKHHIIQHYQHQDKHFFADGARGEGCILVELQILVVMVVFF